MCSSRDTPCALFVVGLCGYWLRAWARILVWILGADFGADFGCGFWRRSLVRILARNFSTGWILGADFFVEGARPQNHAFIKNPPTIHTQYPATIPDPRGSFWKEAEC